MDYLNYRYDVTSFKELNVNDELDYLGMYLSYRDFVSVLKETVQSEDLSDVTQLFFDGARDELDGYYDSKQTEYPIQKPRPEWIEESMDDLIHKIYHSNHFKKNELCTLFLEAAYQTSQRQAGYLLQLYNMVKRQKMIVEDEMFVSSLIVDSNSLIFFNLLSFSILNNAILSTSFKVF